MKNNFINRIIKILFLVLYMFMLLMSTGCAGLLPSLEQTTKSPWRSFEEAKKSFDKIESQRTTKEELKKLGFDPFEVPNVELITYLELIERFMPNQSIRMEDLDEGVRSCLQARDVCQGYEIGPQMIDSKRYGNVFLDLFNFRRKTITTGWHFTALIVLKDGLVVHKVWGGSPNVSKFEDKRNPLGPLQDISKALPQIKLF
ncbi:hypothetical protein [Candidatus Parabeggiatoa sp. HSG14]|uniref:hypothetical protein n=1 Tax=Candidatus Parabeggiatoa sp. HSG14 TaxID=3055593 RepID=UPI0025A8F875|nr:hypothetical protein [Thiotrichales bacterium HSG14]